MRAGTTGDVTRMQAITAFGINVLGTNSAFSSTNTWQRVTTSGLATNAAFNAELKSLGTSSTQLTTLLTGSVHYRCKVTCTAFASTGVSSPVNLISHACYCASGATDSQDGFIHRVRFNTID
jgi:hypothetical protein